MKKQFILSLIIVSVLILAPFNVSKAENNLANRLKGRILLQVEDNGEAWYVSPVNEKRYYMANGDEAYDIMRNLGVGITNNDLEKIQSDKTFAKKHSGKIFLQVEKNGEAFYIDINGNAYYLKNGTEAYNIMRELGLGITNKDLETIQKEGNDLTVILPETLKPIVSDHEQGTEKTVFENKVNIVFSDSMFSPAIFYVNKNQAITLNVSNKSDSKTAVLKFQNNDLSGVGLGVASNEERSITFNAPSFAGEYIYYNAISCNSHYGYEADLEDCWSACVNGSPVFGKMIVTDSLTDLSSQMNVEVPEWECTPTPPSPSSPSPSCQADTWLCDDWGSCSASGSQTRSCSKTFECPSVVTPSPSTSQTCTPPTPEPEPVEYLNTNQAYLSESGIEVTVTNIQKIEEVGSYKYIISYIEKNKTTDKELSPGSFKIFFEAGTGLPQYGFFNNLFPGDSISGSYTFEFLKTKKPFVIEYNNDNEGFFRDIPAPGTLKWSVK